MNMKKNIIKCDEEKMRQLFQLAGICEGECNMDSFKCISLITLIEEKFDVEIPTEYFHESLLSDSKKISKIVISLQEGGKRKNEKNRKCFF